MQYLSSCLLYLEFIFKYLALYSHLQQHALIIHNKYLPGRHARLLLNLDVVCIAPKPLRRSQRRRLRSCRMQGFGALMMSCRRQALHHSVGLHFEDVMLSFWVYFVLAMLASILEMCIRTLSLVVNILTLTDVQECHFVSLSNSDIHVSHYYL